MCTAVLIGSDRPRNPPPHLGSYTRALLVSQDRRHLFVTPWLAISYLFLDFYWSHCNGDSAYIFLFWELRGLSPNFHIHVSVSDLYCIFPGSVHIFPPAEKADPLWKYIIRSQTHECGNWDGDPDIPFLGIFFCFKFSAFCLCSAVKAISV